MAGLWGGRLGSGWVRLGFLELEYPAMPPAQNRPASTQIGFPEWFVELDVVAKEMGGKGYTWLSVAILEDVCKAHSILS